jgi:hypothetical protein
MPLCALSVAVGADDLTLGRLRQHTRLAKGASVADVEQLLAPHVIEIHHPRRVLNSAIGAGDRFQLREPAAEKRALLFVGAFGLGQVVPDVIANTSSIDSIG